MTQQSISIWEEFFKHNFVWTPLFRNMSSNCTRRLHKRQIQHFVELNLIFFENFAGDIRLSYREYSRPSYPRLMEQNVIFLSAFGTFFDHEKFHHMAKFSKKKCFLLLPANSPPLHLIQTLFWEISSCAGRLKKKYSLIPRQSTLYSFFSNQADNPLNYTKFLLKLKINHV